MLRTAVVIIQEHLREKNLYSGTVDGVLDGPVNIAVAKSLTARAAELPGDWQTFPAKRQAVLLFQLICNDKGIACKPLDGYWGPVTQYAYETLLHLRKTGLPRRIGATKRSPAPIRATGRATREINHRCAPFSANLDATR